MLISPIQAVFFPHSKEKKKPIPDDRVCKASPPAERAELASHCPQEELPLLV